MAVHMSLVFSIMVATSVRALEIALCGFYPGLPRFAILRRMLAWVNLTPCPPSSSSLEQNLFHHVPISIFKSHNCYTTKEGCLSEISSSSMQHEEGSELI